MNAKERAAWNVLLDAAQRTDHGQNTRKRLRKAAIAYADTVRQAKNQTQSVVK